MAKRNAHKLARSSRQLGIVLIIGGVLLVGISTTHNILRYRTLRLDKQTVQAHIAEAPNIDQSQHTPTHIFVPWRLDVDIDPAVYDNGNWTISPDHASYLLGSGRVGVEVGVGVGSVEGSTDGSAEGVADGSADGVIDGSAEGVADGTVEGSVLGEALGEVLGSQVPEGLGLGVEIVSKR